MVHITNEGESVSMGYESDSSNEDPDDYYDHDDDDYDDYDFDMDLGRSLNWATDDNPLSEPPADEDAG